MSSQQDIRETRDQRLREAAKMEAVGRLAGRPRIDITALRSRAIV
jgi:hypothetical protein